MMVSDWVNDSTVTELAIGIQAVQGASDGTAKVKK